MSLKTKVIVFIVVVLAVTLGVSFFAFQGLRQEITSVTGGLFLRKQIQFNRQRVLHPLIRELVLAQKLSSSDKLRNWALDEDNPERKQEGLEELESFRRFFSDHCYFFAVRSTGHYYYNDAKGSFTGNQLRYTLSADNPENRWFYGTIESGEDYQLNVDHDEKLGVTKVWINVVVKRDGEALGVAGTGIDLTEFIKKIIDSDDPSVSNVLLEKGGAIQAHSKLQMIDFRSISKAKSDRKTFFSLLDKPVDRIKLENAMAKAARIPGEIEVLPVSVNGRDCLLGLSYIDEIGWYDVSLLDTGKLVTRELYVPFATLLVFSLLMLCLILYLVLNRVVLTRVEALEKSVRDFGQGVLPESTGENRRDEIGRLEEGFKSMAKVVQANTEELEGKVEERTQELLEKNAELEKALDEIKVLAGLLPICAHCKNIRDDKGYWHEVESYVSEHSNAQFTHGICPECMEKHYKDYNIPTVLD